MAESSVPTIPGVKAHPELADHFRREVADLLGRHTLSFPGAQPVSFARNHLEELERQDYYLCEKTDGIRCLLYCTNGDNGEEIAYLIDRKNDFYFVLPAPDQINLHLPHHLDPTFQKFHEGTILDGELVKDSMRDGTRKLRYLVFDCLALDREVLLEKPYSSRLGRLQQFIIKPLNKLKQEHPADFAKMPFEVMFKVMDKPYALRELFVEKLPNLPHGNDGLVFTCVNTPYVSGTDRHILKWKPPHENSIDFRLHLGAFPTYIDDSNGETCEDYDLMPTLQLEVNHGRGDYRDFAPLYITDEEWEKVKFSAVRDNKLLDGRIIECWMDDSGRWRFKAEPDGTPRYRDDKNDANHISTVKSVLQSIEDRISEEDLIARAEGIMRAWKKRHPEEEEAKRRQAQQVQRRGSSSVPSNGQV